MASTQKLNESEDWVTVSISGPRSIIRETRFVQVLASKTWLDVLKGDLKLQIPSNKGFFMCSAKYCASNPKPRQGWKSEITDTVSSYIANFETKRTYYSVRICNPYDISVVAKREQTKRQKRSQENWFSSSNSKKAGKRSSTPPKVGASRMAASRSFLDNSSDSESDSESLEGQLGSPGLSGKQEGIPLNDNTNKKPPFCRFTAGIGAQRDSRVSSSHVFECSRAMINGLNREVNSIKQEGLWGKQIERSPVLCYFAETILKEYPCDRIATQARVPLDECFNNSEASDDSMLGYASSAGDESLSLD